MSDEIQHVEGVDLIPSIDDGWWASILSDEEAQIATVKTVNCSPCTSQFGELLNWDCIQRIFSQDEIILLQVQGFNKGGVLVSGEGIQGFVPVSHLVDFSNDMIDPEKKQKLAEYVGRSLYLKIIECEPENERIVLSERAALAGEGRRKELFKSLFPGATACGVITNVTNFGAFVDLGGIEGLIHVSEISWGRVEKPCEILKIGQPVKVLVLSLDEASTRIALSLKRLIANPWDRLQETYHPGDIVTAEITTMMKFGVFARLDLGIEGLIHISSFPDDILDGDVPHDFYPGKLLQVKILHIDPDRRRLGLGLVAQDD